jgi:hypothetical protein
VIIPRNNNTNLKKVINLSSHTLEEAKINILERGLNFLVSPTSIPFESIICCVEEGIKTLVDEGKDIIRQDCVVILRRSKPPRSNISTEERCALKNLRDNKDLAILREDKGGTTVVMNQTDYNSKKVEHLSQSGSYRKLTSNPITRIIREVRKAIKDTSLDEITKKRLLPKTKITPSVIPQGRAPVE